MSAVLDSAEILKRLAERKLGRARRRAIVRAVSRDLHGRIVQRPAAVYVPPRPTGSLSGAVAVS